MGVLRAGVVACVVCFVCLGLVGLLGTVMSGRPLTQFLRNWLDIGAAMTAVFVIVSAVVYVPLAWFGERRGDASSTPAIVAVGTSVGLIAFVTALWVFRDEPSGALSAQLRRLAAHPADLMGALPYVAGSVAFLLLARRVRPGIANR